MGARLMLRPSRCQQKRRPLTGRPRARRRHLRPPLRGRRGRVGPGWGSTPAPTIRCTCRWWLPTTRRPGMWRPMRSVVEAMAVVRVGMTDRPPSSRRCAFSTRTRSGWPGLRRRAGRAGRRLIVLRRSSAPMVCRLCTRPVARPTCPCARSRHPAGKDDSREEGQAAAPDRDRGRSVNVSSGAHGRHGGACSGDGKPKVLGVAGGLTGRLRR